MTTEKTIRVHGTVILEGSKHGLLAAKKQLRRDYRCYHYRDTAMTVEEVAEPEMFNLQVLADTHGLRIARVHNTHEIHVAAEEKTTKPTKKIVKLDLIAGGWYRTNQTSFPLIHVTQVWNRMSPEGEEMWLFDVDLVDSGALPMPATMSAEQLVEYKLKPATLEDFEELDIAPPAGFEPSPHFIPGTNEEVPEETTAGVSLPQAHLACLALRKQLGYRLQSATVQRTGAAGFLIEAEVRGSSVDLPVVVSGAPVRYRR